jgi:uncharacterized LabA/DUF88 family protein
MLKKHLIISNMKRFAFVDVQNTDSTARKMLGFNIDWIRLSEYLKNSRSCTEVYLYSGIASDDFEMQREFETISQTGCCVVKTKTISSYRNKSKVEKIVCPACKFESVHRIDMGYAKKSNCDTELSVDVMQISGPEVEILLFTGDGDFEYVIRKALEKGVEKVSIYSYAEKYIDQDGFVVSRFSKKLRDLISELPEKVFYVSLKYIQTKIKK